MQLLAGVAVFRTIGNPAGALLLSQGRAGRGFSANLAITLLQLPAIALGASLGAAMGVAAALLALQSAFFAVAYAALIRPVLGPCAVGYFVNLGRPLSAATIMAAIMTLLSLPVGWSPFAVMGVSMVLGGLAYLLAGYAFLPEEWTLAKRWLGLRDHDRQI